MEIVPFSSEPMDLETIRSRARELENILASWNEGASESEELLGDCALNFRRRVEEMVSEWSGVPGFSDDKEFEACLGSLGKELNSVEAENAKMSQDIEALSRTQAEDFSGLEIKLESLKCSLDIPAMQDLEKVKAGVYDDYTRHINDQSSSMNVSGGDKFQLLELKSQIEEKNLILRSLEDIGCIFKWFDTTEQIEDTFIGVKVIALDGNCIRLSLQTYIPISESLMFQQKLEAVNVPVEVKHELLIEVLEGTMNQKNVEIFPGDVYINNVLTATKAFRHSLEYKDKDEIMVARLAGGFDAFIEVSQGWPISNSVLKLTSIKSSDHYTKEFSSSFLSKVKEAANSLEACIRHNVSSFVDHVEKILVELK